MLGSFLLIPLSCHLYRSLGKPTLIDISQNYFLINASAFTSYDG